MCAGKGWAASAFRWGTTHDRCHVPSCTGPGIALAVPFTICFTVP
ncbi:hypothetical protein HMPREF9005_1606, partial [Actinomyces sp. oral taxon 178 str. F0338]